jgi:hypothetical protein
MALQSEQLDLLQPKISPCGRDDRTDKLSIGSSIFAAGQRYKKQALQSPSLSTPVKTSGGLGAGPPAMVWLKSLPCYFFLISG